MRRRHDLRDNSAVVAATMATTGQGRLGRLWVEYRDRVLCKHHLPPVLLSACYLSFYAGARRMLHAQVTISAEATGEDAEERALLALEEELEQQHLLVAMDLHEAGHA